MASRSLSFHSGHRESLGDFEVERAWSTYDFWALMDELVDDRSGFWNNRAYLLDAFIDKRLYVLKVEHCPMELYNDPMFAHSLDGHVAERLLPCFCVLSKTDDSCCDIVWTHTRARRLGLASALLNLLDVTSANNELDEAKPFWEAFWGAGAAGAGDANDDVDLM